MPHKFIILLADQRSRKAPVLCFFFPGQDRVLRMLFLGHFKSQIWKWNKYLFCKKALISAEERCLPVPMFFFSRKPTVGSWSRSKIEWWSIRLCDLPSISLLPSSFNTHCCLQSSRFPAEWCVATRPPNETGKSLLSALTGVTQWVLWRSTMFINWPPAWTGHNYLSRLLYKALFT